MLGRDARRRVDLVGVVGMYVPSLSDPSPLTDGDEGTDWTSFESRISVSPSSSTSETLLRFEARWFVIVGIGFVSRFEITILEKRDGTVEAAIIGAMIVEVRYS